MNDNIIPSLKLIYKPLIMYYGEWELALGLDKISLEKNGKNLFNEFLERYYYMPLKVIIKDDSLIKSFKFSICSKLGESGRTLYFSKRAFLRNLISNADEIVDSSGEDVYKDIKRAIRIRKDIYRDVEKAGEDSPYYASVKEEYSASGLSITFEEFVLLCKKKFTRLLTGYNAVLDLFDKSINVDKFIKCFDSHQLYLFTMYSILKNSKEYYENSGKSDYNMTALDTYRNLVNEIRKEDSFYNTHILIEEDRVYTVDDLFKDYDELLDKINEK